jgi:hypothetical protein
MCSFTQPWPPQFSGSGSGVTKLAEVENQPGVSSTDGVFNCSIQMLFIKETLQSS